MAKFVLLSGENGTIAVNPATITFIEKWTGNNCCIHFIGGEKLVLKEGYDVVCEKLIKGKGFVVPD